MRTLFILLLFFWVVRADCAVLHIGDKNIYMSGEKITSPSLVALINGKKFYAPMRPGDDGGVCTIYNGERYNIFSKLEYLYFDGNSYIDLGFASTPDLNFEIKAWYDDTVINN